MTNAIAFDEWELQKIKRLVSSNVLTYAGYDASNQLSHVEKVEYRKWKALDVKISYMSKPRRHVVEDALKALGKTLEGDDLKDFREGLLIVNSELGVDKAYQALEHEGNYAPYEALIERHSAKLAHDPAPPRSGDVVESIKETWETVVQSINPAKAELKFSFVDEDAMNAAQEALFIAAGWKDD